MTTKDDRTFLEWIADSVARLTIGWTEPVQTPAWDEADEPLRGPAPMLTGVNTFPGLITQLDECLLEATPASEETKYRPAPTSRAPIPDEPFDVLEAIKRFETTTSPLASVVGYAATRSDPEQRGLSLELRALVARAEIALGHRFDKAQLVGPCPVCSTDGSLYANRDLDGTPTDAYCSARGCGANWPKHLLEFLGAHLRHEQEQQRKGNSE